MSVETGMKAVVGLIVGVSAVALSACSGATGASPSRPSGNAHAATTVTTAIVEHRRPQAALSARLVLTSFSVTAGSSVLGRVIVQNATGHVVHGTGCGRPFQVVLVNDSVHQDPEWLKCVQRFNFPIGQSSYTVTVSGSYLSCVSGARSGFPSCLPTGKAPPLPSGAYHATVVQQRAAIPPPPPTTVQVIQQQPAP